jgi:hypothetical protein
MPDRTNLNLPFKVWSVCYLMILYQLQCLFSDYMDTSQIEIVYSLKLPGSFVYNLTLPYKLGKPINMHWLILGYRNPQSLFRQQTPILVSSPPAKASIHTQFGLPFGLHS